VNQEDSEHNEVDGMKKGVDSTGKVMHLLFICHVFKLCAGIIAAVFVT